MKFNDNLIKLRKRDQLSQDALAEKIGVTRQTIYKWESSITYPELDKLMDLAKIFNVTVDYLVDGDIDEEETELPKEQVIKAIKKQGLFLGISIAVIIIGVSLLVLFSETNIFLSVGLGIGVILLGSLLTTIVSLKMEAFKKIYNINISFTKKEKIKEHNNNVVYTSIGVAIILIAVLQLIITAIFVDDKSYEDVYMIYSASLLLFLIAISVLVFVYSGTIYSLYEDPKSLTKTYKPKKEEELVGKICGVIMILATIAFFIVSFVFGQWEFCWLPFAIGGVLCAIPAIIFSKDSSNNNTQDETTQNSKEDIE